MPIFKCAKDFCHPECPPGDACNYRQAHFKAGFSKSENILEICRIGWIDAYILDQCRCVEWEGSVVAHPLPEEDEALSEDEKLDVDESKVAWQRGRSQAESRLFGTCLGRKSHDQRFQKDEVYL